MFALGQKPRCISVVHPSSLTGALSRSLVKSAPQVPQAESKSGSLGEALKLARWRFATPALSFNHCPHLQDSMFNKHFSKNKRVEKLDSKKTEEQQKSITELIRSTVLVYTDIVSLTHFVDSSSKKLTLALGCADGKVCIIRQPPTPIEQGDGHAAK